MRNDELQARQEIVRFGRLCYERHLLVAMDGNLSVRLEGGEVVCTRAGCHKGFLCDDDIVVIDAKGNKRRGMGKPTSEILMHLAFYEERPDVRAVIHAHPPLCVAFTIAGVSMARCVLPEVVLTLGVIPTAPYETTGTVALAERIRGYTKGYDAILMDTHGAVCAGASLLEAFCRLETMEQSALVMKTAHDLGRIRELPREEAENLRRIGISRYGGPPEARTEPLPPRCAECTGCACPHEEGIAPRQDLRLVRVTRQPLMPPLGERHIVPEKPVAPPRDDLTNAVVDEVLRALRR